MPDGPFFSCASTNCGVAGFWLVTRDVTGYTVMIGSIKHKGLAALYYDDLTKGVKQSLVKRLRQILALLATACTAEDMNVPGLKFHQLKGDLAGFYAVSVSGNWRVIFRFESDQATDVDLIDYH